MKKKELLKAMDEWAEKLKEQGLVEKIKITVEWIDPKTRPPYPWNFSYHFLDRQIEKIMRKVGFVREKAWWGVDIYYIFANKRTMYLDMSEPVEVNGVQSLQSPPKDWRLAKRMEKYVGDNKVKFKIFRETWIHPSTNSCCKFLSTPHEYIVDCIYWDCDTKELEPIIGAGPSKYEKIPIKSKERDIPEEKRYSFKMIMEILIECMKNIPFNDLKGD